MMIDIDSVEWLSQDRFQPLQEQLKPSLELLLYSGCLDKILIMWIRKEIVNDFRANNLTLCKDKSEIEILNLWCFEEWGSRLNELFLQKKDQLDLVSFRLVRIKNQAVALEAYHRLKEKESNFDYVARLFAVSSDKNKDTLKKNKRMGSLPIELQKKIRTMKIGDLSKPLQSNQCFILLQLENFEDAKFSETIKDKILMDQFSSWASTVVKVMRDRLESINT